MDREELFTTTLDTIKTHFGTCTEKFKSTARATYAGIVCGGISLHHVSLFVDQKLLRKNTITNYNIMFLIVDTRNINQIFTENSYFQKGTVPSIADYLCKVPFDATVERE